MKKAFTVVELLLVVFVIGILIAVLSSSLSSGSDAANCAKCLANMRSLAMACQSYGMLSGVFPFAGSAAVYVKRTRGQELEAEHGWIGWPTNEGKGNKYISPYSDDVEARRASLENGQIWRSVEGGKSVYVCPAHAHYVRDRMKTKDGPLWSYAMNAWFGWDPSGKGSRNRQGASYTGTTRTDRILLFAELPFLEVKISPKKGGFVQECDRSREATRTNDPILQYYQNSAGDSGKELIGFNHRGTGKGYSANVVFADGHVERIALPDRPRRQNLMELTKWLCVPSLNGSDIDIVYEMGEYKAMK